MDITGFWLQVFLLKSKYSIYLDDYYKSMIVICKKFH